MENIEKFFARDKYNILAESLQNIKEIGDKTKK